MVFLGPPGAAPANRKWGPPREADFFAPPTYIPPRSDQLPALRFSRVLRIRMPSKGLFPGSGVHLVGVRRGPFRGSFQYRARFLELIDFIGIGEDTYEEKSLLQEVEQWQLRAPKLGHFSDS